MTPKEFFERMCSKHNDYFLLISSDNESSFTTPLLNWALWRMYKGSEESKEKFFLSISSMSSTLSNECISCNLHDAVKEFAFLEGLQGQRFNQFNFLFDVGFIDRDQLLDSFLKGKASR